MNIAVIIERYQPTGGGNERSTEQVVTGLAERGHMVTVLAGTARVDQPPPEPNIRVVCAQIPTRSAMGLWRFRRWAIEQLRAGSFDASLSMTLSVPAGVIEPRSGTARQTLIRNIALRSNGLGRTLKELSACFSPKQRALLLAERLTLNDPAVRRIVAISRYVVDQLFEHYSIAARRIALVPNAAMPPTIGLSERQRVRRDMRASLGIEQDQVLFLFAAMNPRLKGLAVLLEALARLDAPTSRRVRVLIAGTLDRRWQRQAERLGVRQLVRWIGPTEAMEQLFAAADVTVLPTFYDPASKVVIESLLRGVPAISTRHNGASQWIDDPTGRSDWRSAMSRTGTAELVADQLHLQAGSGGIVLDDPADTAALAGALTQISDDAFRDRCADNIDPLDARLTMSEHVSQLEQILRESAG